MNTRLVEIIKYRTGGKQAQFAAFMGWSPQYLSKLVKGKDFGIAPVIALLQHLPEIDARWLLLGEGSMLLDDKLVAVRASAQSYILSILEMEKYLPVMTPLEVKAFEQMCLGDKQAPQFSAEQVAGWQSRLEEHNRFIDAKFNDALCKQPKAKQ